MMVMGDELAKSHDGNNNWYGHDTPMAHMQWDGERDEAKAGLLRFMGELIAFRVACPLLGREEFLGWAAGWVCVCGGGIGGVLGGVRAGCWGVEQGGVPAAGARGVPGASTRPLAPHPLPALPSASLALRQPWPPT